MKDLRSLIVSTLEMSKYWRAPHVQWNTCVGESFEFQYAKFDSSTPDLFDSKSTVVTTHQRDASGDTLEEAQHKLIRQLDEALKFHGEHRDANSKTMVVFRRKAVVHYFADHVVLVMYVGTQNVP